MTESTMRQIAAAAEENHLTLSPYTGYSGRGMFGEKTCAIVAASHATFAAAVAYATAVSDDPESLAADLRSMRSDSLGRDVVMY